MQVSQLIENAPEIWEKVYAQVEKRIVGYKPVVKKILATVLAGGHALITGVPGLAKTTLVKTLAQVLDLKFSRIQFTPDLMPSDILGTEIIDIDEKGHKFFKFVKGPVFGNLILADEINRTPPKTQSALLEAMQEHKITVQGKTYQLPEPFTVLATRNPIEQEGTYPLPEAQLDRFMLEIVLDYPDENEEKQIIGLTSGEFLEEPEKILNVQDILTYQKLVLQMPAPEHVVEEVVKIIRNTRPSTSNIPKIKELVKYGAGPRAGQHLMLISKALALLEGEPVPKVRHVRQVVHDVLRHRIILSHEALFKGYTKEDIISIASEFEA